MTENSYTKSHFDDYIYFNMLKDRSFIYLLQYVGLYVESINEQGRDRRVEGITKKWIWDEKS